MATAVKRAGLSPTTANQAHRVLSVALTAAQRDELVDSNVATLVPAPRKARSSQQALSLNECQLVFAEADRSELPSLWYAALFTGARQGSSWDCAVTSSTGLSKKSRGSCNGCPGVMIAIRAAGGLEARIALIGRCRHQLTGSPSG
jgi:hypothetical protein